MSLLSHVISLELRIRPNGSDIVVGKSVDKYATGSIEIIYCCIDPLKILVSLQLVLAVIPPVEWESCRQVPM